MRKSQWSKAFSDDGQVFTARNGLNMGAYIELYGLSHSILDSGAESVELENGIVIIDGGGWDFKHDNCTCGKCWEGQGATPKCQEGGL